MGMTRQQYFIMIIFQLFCDKKNVYVHKIYFFSEGTPWHQNSKVTSNIFIRISREIFNFSSLNVSRECFALAYFFTGKREGKKAPFIIPMCSLNSLQYCFCCLALNSLFYFINFFIWTFFVGILFTLITFLCFHFSHLLHRTQHLFRYIFFQWDVKKS